mmetsp:Transcript_66968/g.143207  ORF Transcript_66968/g.143207 Transcript_66968/m.143207 type:complete len:115 (+) Transcript_66968:464-808(+)
MSSNNEDVVMITKPATQAAHAARLASIGRPAPSSLLTLMLTAMPRLSGGMKQMLVVLVIKASADKLRWGRGSNPASKTVISEAHHSDIIRKFGSAKRRNEHHLVNVNFEKPCQE